MQVPRLRCATLGMTASILRMGDAEEFAHFFVEESVAGAVGLDPGAVDNELWDGALAGVADDFGGGARDGLDIDLLVGDLVLIEEALGDAAVGTPGGCVYEQVHGSSLDYQVKFGDSKGNRRTEDRENRRTKS